MSRPIQALAPGYLGLLGLKNNGRLPLDQIDTVQPTVDIEPYYLQGRAVAHEASVEVDNTSTNPVSFFPQLLVPDGKVWVVLGGAVYASIAQADVFSVGLQLRAANVNLGAADRIISESLSVGSPEVVAAAMLSATTKSARILPGFMLQPGDEIIPVIEWNHGADSALLVCRITIAELQQ